MNIVILMLLLASLSIKAQVGVENEIKVWKYSHVYDFETKKLLSPEEIEASFAKGICIERDYDEYGNPLTYYFIKGIGPEERFDYRDYLSDLLEGEKLPSFLAKTYKGKKVSKQDFLGKPLVMVFYLMLKPPFAPNDEMMATLMALSKNDKINVIVFVGDEVDGTEPMIAKENLGFPIVPNAMGFAKKYRVYHFPGYLLVDKEGVYKGSYNEEALFQALSSR